MKLPLTSIQNLTSILQKCRKDGNSVRLTCLHVYMNKHGLDAHSVLGNLQVQAFVEVGNMYSSQLVFEKLIHCDELTWSTLIAGYVHYGKPHTALLVYKQIQGLVSICPSVHAFVALLKASAQLKDLTGGQEIHAEVARNGFLAEDQMVGCTLVDMYIKCDYINKAQEVFDKLQSPNVISWTALISGYVQMGNPEEAINLYEKMQLVGIRPDAVTFIFGLKACGILKCVGKGQEIHADIDRSRLLEKNNHIGNSLIDMYAKCGDLHKARQVFDNLLSRDVVSWTTLMGGYVDHGNNEEAIELYRQMQHKFVPSSAQTYVYILKACAALGAEQDGYEIHSEIESKGLVTPNVQVGNALMDMYGNFGFLDETYRIFDKYTDHDKASWNILIASYSDHGFGKEAIKCFKQMQLQDVYPNAATFVSIIKACGNSVAAKKAQEIHASIAVNGVLDKDLVVGTALVDIYVKCGLFNKAKQVFDQFEDRNILMWNSLISGYIEHGHNEEALRCFHEMQMGGLSPDTITFASCLKACSNLRLIDIGERIYQSIQQFGFFEDLLVGTALVDMYAKFGMLCKAQLLFDKLQMRNTISWNTMLAGYGEHGYSETSLMSFEMMQYEGISPNATTYVHVLKSCGNLKDIDKGFEIHSEILKKGILESESLIDSSLVDMYGRCGLLLTAQYIFDKVPVQNTITWNTLIAKYDEYGYSYKALNLYKKMQSEGLSPDDATFVCILKACGSIGDLDLGQELHAKVLKEGLADNNLIINSTINMYAKCGSVVKAQEIFDKVSVPTVITWNSLLAGYIERDNGEVVLKYLADMQSKGFSPNTPTFIYSLKACSSLGAIDKGYEIHAEIEKKGLFDKDLIIVGTSLVDMYARCGLLSAANEVFEKLPIKGIVSWNSLIAGYAQAGESESVFFLFNRMVRENVSPDLVTFVIVLHTCSQIGISQKGDTFFESMSSDYGIIPTLEHHNCIIDLLARAGHFDRVTTMINRLPYSPDLTMWHTVLGACMKSGNTNLARHSFEHAVRLDVKDPSAYILMSNIYAGTNDQEKYIANLSKVSPQMI